MIDQLIRKSNADKAPRAGTLYESSTLINVGTRERVASAGLGAWLLNRGMQDWSKHPFSNIFRLAAGSYLLYRGVSGNCPISATLGKQTGDKHANAINIRTEAFVDSPKEFVYRYWRQLDNLPNILSHIKEVRQISHTRSIWTLATPRDFAKIQWEAEIVEDQPGETLSWRSLKGSMIENAGKISFEDTKDGGTLLSLLISYRAPAGYIGSSIAGLLNPIFKQLVKNDMSRFKKYMERISLREKA